LERHACRNKHPKLTRKKIENITNTTGFCFIEFCVGASTASDTGKFFVLDVKNLRECSTRGAHLSGLTGIVIAFWTGIISNLIAHYNGCLRIR
jgi:hypothetical protein